MDQGFDLEFDPPRDGNYLFGVISSQLASLGIHRMPQMVINEIIGYLTEHSTNQDGWPLDLWMHDESFSGYLSRMSRDKEYGDHLTLRAAANLYNVNITVVSTLGPEGTVISVHFTSTAIAEYILVILLRVKVSIMFPLVHKC